MTTYYIVWNPARNEGFVTTDPEDADYVRTGFSPNMALPTAGQAFREAYCDDEDDGTELPMQEIEIEATP